MKALLVDSGGVLFRNITEDTPFFLRVGERYGVDPMRVRAHYEAHDQDFEVGGALATDVLRSALAALGTPPASVHVEDLHDMYARCIVPHLEVIALLRRLRRTRGRPLLVLANNEAPDWEILKHQRTSHLDIFDVLASSWVVGEVKPTIEYFAKVLDLCRVAPVDACLVDDNPECVSAARYVGMQSIIYTGVEAWHTEVTPRLRDVSGVQ